MLTIYSLLTCALTTLFETKIIRVGAFKGRGRKKLDIPADYFSGDRLRRCPERPINVLCGKRVGELACRVLDGKSDCDVYAFSRAVRNLVYDLYGRSLLSTGLPSWKPSRGRLPLVCAWWYWAP